LRAVLYVLAVAATPSVKVVKQMLYKGAQHKWSNRYHFNGGTPADDSHWQTLFTNIRNAEKLVLDGNVGIVEVVGYAAGSDVPVATWTGSVGGTAAPANTISCPGNDAGLVRYATTARTSKNHPIYLFNYYHWAYRDSTSSDTNTINAGWKTLLETYATAWIAGFSDGTNTYVRAGPNGATAVSRLVEPWLTHRDFRT